MKRTVMILGFAATLLLTPTGAHAQSNEGCDMNRGPEKVAESYVLYQREVLDDLISKFDAPTPDEWSGMVELHNDYLCDLPIEMQEMAIADAEDMIYRYVEVYPRQTQRVIERRAR